MLDDVFFMLLVGEMLVLIGLNGVGKFICFNFING